MSSGVPISGETYNLTCTVEANVQPTVQWLYSNSGSRVTNESNITVETEKTTNSTTILTLSFNPLSTSHGGQYTCQSTTDTPPSTVNATRNVTVQSEYYRRSEVFVLQIFIVINLHVKKFIEADRQQKILMPMYKVHMAASF